MTHYAAFLRTGFKSILLVALTAILSGCYVNLKHTIDREVRVQIVETVPLTITNTGNSSFSSAASESELISKYLDGLKAELGGTTNVILVDENPEYMVYIDRLTIEESTKEEKINDSDSPDHGKIFELTTLDITAEGSVKKVASGTSYSWFANKNKSESTTSSRSAGQVITGENQEKNLYREKEFDATTASDLTNTTGSRSGVVIVKEISKSMK